MSHMSKNSKNKSISSPTNIQAKPDKTIKRFISDFPEINGEQNDNPNYDRSIQSNIGKDTNSEAKTHRLNQQILNEDIEFSDNNEDECNICTSKTFFDIQKNRNWESSVLR